VLGSVFRKAIVRPLAERVNQCRFVEYFEKGEPERVTKSMKTWTMGRPGNAADQRWRGLVDQAAVSSAFQWTARYRRKR